MKRTLLLILALCLLLTGCGVPGEADTQSSDTSEELSTETTTEPIKEASLLDSCEAFDDSGALWYIPNQQIEAQQYPMLRAFAGNLLDDNQLHQRRQQRDEADALERYNRRSAAKLHGGAYRICRTTDSRGPHCRMRQSVWNGRRAGGAPSGRPHATLFPQIRGKVPWL